MNSPTHSSSSTKRQVQILFMAAQALCHNKLRTSLTMLGVIIGISSVIATSSVGQGVQKSTEEQLKGLGTNVLLVLPGAAQTKGVNQGGGSMTTLTLNDAQAIAAQAPAVKSVSPFLQRQVQVVYTDKNTFTAILGTDVNFPKLKRLYLQEGRFFDAEEFNSAQPVVVLGSKVRDELFGRGNNAVGKDVRIQGNRYKVIGVMEPKGSLGNTDQDDRVYIPLKNMSAQIVGQNALSGIALSGLLLESMSESDLDVQFQVTNFLRVRHNIYPPQADDFRIINQVDVIKTLNYVIGLFTAMGAAIASISLVVGGIGIANIMLVSVVERTKEIGIRKAIGARNSDILLQFLAEAVAVSTVGGIVGISLGIGIAFGAATLFKFHFVVSLSSVAASVVISFSIGLLAGVIPARNAALLEPIIALRSEW